MKFLEKNPPREYTAGYEQKRIIKDCGVMQLGPDEQITLLTESGNQYDVTRKEWGFYATPSMNGRLLDFHLRAVLIKNRMDKFFIMLVEKGKEDLFEKYIDEEILTIVCWMDRLDNLKSLEKKCNSLI